MSEAVHIETGKINKSEAIRRAMEALGNDASSKELQAHAVKLAGTDIDIRAVYQMKSNLKTEKKHSKPAKKAEKAEKKVARTIKPKASGTKIEFDIIEQIAQIKMMVETLGGRDKFLQLFNAVA